MAEKPTEMRNPFQNESDAFRILVMIVAGAALVIAAAVIVGSWLGLIIAAIGISIGLYASIGWLRVGLMAPDDEPSSSDDPPV